MKKMLAVMTLLFLAVGCGEQSSTTAPPPAAGPTVGTIGITVDKTSINSNGIDSATLTILALSSTNAVVPGATITISAPAGALSANQLTTDANGRATVTFNSGFTTANQAVLITASSGTAVDTVNINIIGTTVEFSASTTSVLLNGGNTVTLTAVVRDGSGNLLPNVAITMSSSGLGTLTNLSTQASGALINLTTNAQGQATASYAAGNVPGIDTVTLTSPAGQRTLQLNVTGASFSLAHNAVDNTINLSGGTAAFTLTWIDAGGLPVVGSAVTFSTGQGLLGNGQSSQTLTTNAAGQATVNFTPQIAGPATVTVIDAAGANQDSATITVVAVNPNSVALQIAPTVVATANPVTGSTPTATLTATVRDALNNAVANQDVTFSIVTGPGGGERIEPVVARTNAAGIATSTFFSGGATSAQNGVTIRATLNSNTAISGGATLTIGAQAARITFGTSNTINTINIGGIVEVYALPITVLVTDNNGNAIANQAVSLGLYPLTFSTGFYIDGTNAATQIVSDTFNNEDLNRNGILDPGEDGGTGYPVNGLLDPGNVASIPQSVVTDANGFAAFNITYSKSFGNWVVVELSASTTVSGNLATARINAALAVEEGDTPFINSPFGP